MMAKRCSVIGTSGVIFSINPVKRLSLADPATVSSQPHDEIPTYQERSRQLIVKLNGCSNFAAKGLAKPSLAVMQLLPIVLISFARWRATAQLVEEVLEYHHVLRTILLRCLFLHDREALSVRRQIEEFPQILFCSPQPRFTRQKRLTTSRVARHHHALSGAEEQVMILLRPDGMVPSSC